MTLVKGIVTGLVVGLVVMAVEHRLYDRAWTLKPDRKTELSGDPSRPLAGQERAHAPERAMLERIEDIAERVGTGKH